MAAARAASTEATSSFQVSTSCCIKGRQLWSHWASNDDIDYFLGTWLPVLHRDFPRAAIVVTIPSQYLDETVDASGLEAYVVRLNDRIAAWKVANPAAANLAVSVVAEPNTADPSFVCNQGHHFNNKGRTFRTNALWEALTEAPIVHN